MEVDRDTLFPRLEEMAGQGSIHVQETAAAMSQPQGLTALPSVRWRFLELDQEEAVELRGQT